MACTYKFNGLTFKSELDLDDYLMRNKELLEKYPDIVFEAEGDRLQLSVISKLDINTHDRVSPARDKMKKIRDLYDDWDLESHKIDPPYLGVNDFLKGLKNPNNPSKYLFPEFVKEEYWKRKKEKWTSGDYWFTDEGKKELSDVFEPDYNGDYNPHALTNSEFDAAVDKVEAKWKALGKIGDEIHNVLAAYWRNVNKGHSVDLIKKILMDPKNTKSESNPNGIDRGYMPDSMISVLLDYCQKLHDELKNKFGDDIIVKPELHILGDSYDLDGKHNELMGIIDLLVIDRTGGVHIIDYKTSPKEFDDYNNAKKLAFQYQLATYRKILELAGIYFNYNCRMLIAPIKIDLLHEIDGEWRYSNLIPYENIEGDGNKSALIDITNNIMFDATKHNLFATINRNLDALVPVPEIIDLTGEEILLLVHDEHKRLLPNFEGDRPMEDEEIDKLIKRKGYDKQDPNDNKYHYDFAHKRLTANTYPELFNLVKTELKTIRTGRLDKVQGIKRVLKQAIDTKNEAPEITGYRYGNGQWLNNKLWKYCNGNWKIIDDMSIEALGIIMFENQITRQVDYIKITTSNVNESKPFYLFTDTNGKPKKGLKARILLSGNFTSDIVQINRPNSLMAESTVGNMELIETALVINKLAERLKRNDNIIGNVQVINPFSLESAMMNNKLLAYCFKELTRLGNIENKLGTENGVLLASPAMLARNKLEEIYNYGSSTKVKWSLEILRGKGMKDPRKWRNVSKKYKELTRYMQNDEELRVLLLEVANDLEHEMTTTSNGKSNDNFTESYNEELDPARYVYEEVMMAIGELGGLLFRQLLSDHARFLSDPAIWKGWSGNELDNPGNLSSLTLNAITLLNTIAYLNIRSEIDRELAKILKLVQALKDEKGFGYFKERTYGNQSNLYSNMTYRTADGNWKFKDPATDTTLTTAEKNFLNYAIAKINYQRFGDEEGTFEAHQGQWFDVPLTPGGADSMASTAGFLNTIKNSLKGLNPKEAARRAREITEGIFDPNTDESFKRLQKDESDMWHMINVFDAGNSAIRLNMLNNSGREIGYWEHNLETLLLKHTYAYSLEEHMTEVLPLIKATLIHLGLQGVIVNLKFEKDIKYLRDYVNNKIHNRSLIDPKDRPAMEAALKGMRWASITALAFSPLLLYLVLDGIWKDISLMIRKPDGDTSFTFKNMKDAFFLVYKDTVHYGNKKSLCELLNQYYGINDMDMNTYAEKIKSDQGGFWNFTSLAFRFASRPDFYNRLTIFGALMRGDGCWEAHSVDKDGNLVYNIKKDKRFEVFVNGWVNDARYNLLKGLFIQMAQQMMKEHTRDRNGNLYRMDLNHPDLPKAYTTLQSESMKALGDLTYGYYAHEKKALFNGTAIGTLFMQMITYWSSKKNQWLAQGGIKSQGYYKQYEEALVNENGKPVLDSNGKPVMEKYWLEVDSEGNVSDIPTKNPTDPTKAIPYMVWQGLYLEGIIITISKLINDLIHGDPSGKDSRWRFIKSEYWYNEDESVRRAYRLNLHLFWNDFLMFILLGLIIGPGLQEAAKLHGKERGNDDITNALINTAEGWAAAIVEASGADFNMIKSVFGKSYDWTPFAVESISRTLGSLSEVISGDMRFYDAVVKSTAVGRTVRPVFEYLNPKEI